MTNMHSAETLRKHAVPLVPPAAGSTLIKSTPHLGKMVEKRKVRVPIDIDFPVARRKDFLFRCARQFIDEERRRDGAQCYPKTMRVHGPFPHFEPHEPDTQIGDRGGRRKVARSVRKDTSDNGKLDYVLEADFLVPEYINEIPTELALELFNRPGGRPGLMPLRDNDWRKVRRANKW